MAAATVTGNVVSMGVADTWSPPTASRPPICRIAWTPSAAAKTLTIKSGSTQGSGNILFTFTSLAADAGVLKVWDIPIQVPSGGLNSTITAAEANVYLYLQAEGQV